MKFEKKSYNDKNYIQYSDDENNITFTNAEYFVFNTKSEKFENIMHGVGGFTANMTTRLMRDTDLDISYIMLCCIPQEFNDYVCAFLYLDCDGDIVKSIYDNNYFDYKYFKEKFADCTVKEGFVFDLENNEKFKAITDMFHPNPSTEFNFTANGETISYDDTLIYNGIDIFRNDMQEKLQKLNAKHVTFRFDCNPLTFISLEGRIIDENDNILQCYQVKSGIKDKNEYLESMRLIAKDFPESRIDTDEFVFTLNLDTARKLATKLEIAR